MPKRIFTFRKGEAERPADAIESLGLKGANLALLASLDLPVPPGFTISTAAWREAKASGESMPMALRSDLNAMVEWLERVTDRRFDGDRRPLLLAVRTSGPAAMPGLADSVLDIGLNDRTVEILALLSQTVRLGSRPLPRSRRRRLRRLLRARLVGRAFDDQGLASLDGALSRLSRQ